MPTFSTICSLRSLILLLLLPHGIRIKAESPQWSREQNAKGAVHVDVTSKDHQHDFFKFATRPDIDAPRWNVTVFDKAAVSPGFWFVSPLEIRPQMEPGGPWIGPHIYDATGMLVWSGGPMFKGYHVVDFTVSRIDGEGFITLIHPIEMTGFILNSSYEICGEFPVGDRASEHLYARLINDGKNVLTIGDHEMKSSGAVSEGPAVQGQCNIVSSHFEDLDRSSRKQLFYWAAEDHVGLEESVIPNPSPRERCEEGWDYFHANSVDKFADGDYLVSGQNTNTLYKVARDGSIVWRLGGVYSDFEFDDEFSSQQDARILEQNETHTVISLVDNPPKAKGDSRGLLLALQTADTPMTALIMTRYELPLQPSDSIANSLQMLPNGHAFLSGTSHSLQSEHSSSGDVVFQASMKAYLQSHSAYKFPWVGRPKPLPDVNSTTAFVPHVGTTTMVYCSWNGATEIASWNLYSASSSGGDMIKLLGPNRQQGFETQMKYSGYAEYVVVEALDRDGKVLSVSKAVKTLDPRALIDLAVIEETQGNSNKPEPSLPSISSSLALFCSALACCLTFALIMNKWLARKNHKPALDRTDLSQEPLLEDENETDEFLDGQKLEDLRR